MLQPVHKSTVKSAIRKGKAFDGYIAPSNVNSDHITSGWHIGMKVEFTTAEDMEKTIAEFAFYNCNGELGQRVRFWANK